MCWWWWAMVKVHFCFFFFFIFTAALYAKAKPYNNKITTETIYLQFKEIKDVPAKDNHELHMPHTIELSHLKSNKQANGMQQENVMERNRDTKLVILFHSLSFWLLPWCCYYVIILGFWLSAFVLLSYCTQNDATLLFNYFVYRVYRVPYCVYIVHVSIIFIFTFSLS